MLHRTREMSHEMRRMSAGMHGMCVTSTVPPPYRMEVRHKVRRRSFHQLISSFTSTCKQMDYVPTQEPPRI